MGSIFLARGSTELFSRGYLAKAFDFPCVFRTHIGYRVSDTCEAHILITIFLEFFEPYRTFVEGIDYPGVFIGVGEEHGGGFGIHEDGSELGGGNLKADFRELLGIVFTQVVGEVILEVSDAELVFLLGTPFLVTAASAPVGDIAFGDGDAALCQSPDDLGIADIIVKELIDHVALGFGQAGNFSVAHALVEQSSGSGWVGEDARVRIVSGLGSCGCGRLNSATLDEGAFLFDPVGAVVKEVSEGRGGAGGVRDGFDVENHRC